MKRLFGFKGRTQSGTQGPMKDAAAPNQEVGHSAGRRILVSSNCQTGGIAAALQVIFPDDAITPAPLPAMDKAEVESDFVEKLRNTDVWVSIGGYELLEKHGLREVQLVRIPIIRFSGFHPDLVYARRASTNELIMPHYNSAIAVWAYKNNTALKDAAKLFNEQTYSELGYLSYWERSVAELKQRFKDTDLQFPDFMLAMRREGLFMYSLNHPKVMALSRLAKLTALKMGASAAVLDRHIDINDGLNEIIWPVYPGIGESLSLPSEYLWKTGEGQWTRGVEDFLKSAYDNYANQKIAPQDITAVQVDEKLYDRVLGAQLGVKA